MALAKLDALFALEEQPVALDLDDLQPHIRWNRLRSRKLARGRAASYSRLSVKTRIGFKCPSLMREKASP